MKWIIKALKPLRNIAVAGALFGLETKGSWKYEDGKHRQ